MEYPEYPQDNRILFKPEIPKDKILVWEKDLDRKKLGYSEKSMRHPAKMHILLTQWILKKFTKPGETVCDPMAGIGTTGIEAMRLGRNCLMVEYEQKFVDWTEESIRNLEKQEFIGKKGKVKVLRGDARELTKTLSGYVDEIVFNPPYSSNLSAMDKSFKNKFESNPDHGGSAFFEKEYSQDPENIGNLKYGKGVDAVVMSPPYSSISLGAISAREAREEIQKLVKKSFKEKGYFEYRGKRYTEEEWLKLNNGRYDGRCVIKWGSESYSKDKNSDNIGNLPQGNIDAVIMSPPYANSLNNKNLDFDKQIERMRKAGVSEERIKTFMGKYSGMRHEKGAYTDDKDSDNIGNLPQGSIDAIVTSPPYAHESTASKKTKLEKEGKFKMGHSTEVPYTTEDYRFRKGVDRGNLGKLKMFRRIPCSPDDPEAKQDKRPERKGTIWEFTKEIKVPIDAIVPSPTTEQTDLGNLKGKTYLSEMKHLMSIIQIQDT